MRLFIPTRGMTVSMYPRCEPSAKAEVIGRPAAAAPTAATRPTLRPIGEVDSTDSQVRDPSQNARDTFGKVLEN